MSQCHDSYQFPTPKAGSRLLTDSAPEATACHDEYPPDSRPIIPGHACEVRESRRGDVRVLRVTGRLDWASAPGLWAHLRDDCTDPGVVIDLLDAQVDAAGIGAVLTAAAKDRRRHQNLVVVTSGTDRQVLLGVGFNEVASLATSERQALELLHKRGLETGDPADAVRAR